MIVIKGCFKNKWYIFKNFYKNQILNNLIKTMFEIKDPMSASQTH